MVTERCHPHETLAAISELAPGDLRRTHLDGCPRCRARLVAYRAFMAGDLPSGLDLDPSILGAARSQLDAVMTREIYGTDLLPAGRSGLHTRLVNLAAKSWRPALAAAAVLVLVFGLKTNQVPLNLPLPSPGTESLLRGTVERSQTDYPLRVEPGPDKGTWHLAWEAPERTTASAVVLYDTDLAEVARLDAGEAEEFLLQSEMISTPQSIAFVRVVFAVNGDEIGRSQARTLTF